MLIQFHLDFKMLLVIYCPTGEGNLYIQHHLRLQVKGVYLAWYLFVQALYFSCSLYMASVVRDLHFMADFPQTPAHSSDICLSLWHCVNPDLSTVSLICQTDTSNSTPVDKKQDSLHQFLPFTNGASICLITSKGRRLFDILMPNN